jgi:hypothetical protein
MAGVATAPPPLDESPGPGSTPDGPAPILPPAGGDARAEFDSTVRPLLVAECGSCHADAVTIGPDFLLGEPYDSIMGWIPTLVVPGDPGSSRLVTYGAHAGPALSATALAAAEAWITAEGGAGPGVPGGGVDGNQLPLASFDVVFDADPFTLTFDASRSTDPDGTVVSYEWAYGDGQTGEGTTVTHTYDAVPNTYSVALTVYDDLGDSGTTRQVIDVGTGAARVVRFTLVDADTDTDIRPLVNGDDLELAALPSISIRADTVPETVGSVAWNIDGEVEAHVENANPYTINGDDGGNYNPYELTPGAHTVAAIAYTEGDTAGVAGPPLTISFTVR